MLNRFRHFPAIDREALRMVLMRISEMVCELPQIFEMHVNPLIVDDLGAIVVDVCMVVQRHNSDAGDYRHMAIHPYPANLTCEITLKDGQDIILRPMRPEDAVEEQSFVRQLSSEAKYFRFMHVISEFTPEMLSKMTKLDYDREMAFVATHEDNSRLEHIVGVSRYSINPDKTSCEFAITVADAWQGRGLAKALMESLIECARDKGLEHMTGTVLVNNFSMRRLMERMGFSGQRCEEDPDILEFEYALQGKGTALTDSTTLAGAN
jgi:acetyltransferase